MHILIVEFIEDPREIVNLNWRGRIKIVRQMHLFAITLNQQKWQK